MSRSRSSTLAVVSQVLILIQKNLKNFHLLITEKLWKWKFHSCLVENIKSWLNLVDRYYSRFENCFKILALKFKLIVDLLVTDLGMKIKTSLFVIGAICIFTTFVNFAFFAIFFIWGIWWISLFLWIYWISLFSRLKKNWQSSEITNCSENKKWSLNFHAKISHYHINN